MATLRDNVTYDLGPGFARKVIEGEEGGCYVVVSQEGEGDYEALVAEALAAGAQPPPD